MAATIPTRDELATMYLDQLPYDPYPVQEEALLQWFMSDEGVMVCAPTGMGKTLIAEAALFEALHTGKVAYYTTPLIALTEQKFQEMQDAAVRWGFEADDVGLVTGNRRVNPNAQVLVVVAEILLNRLLHHDAFDFSNVASVVMDEFHSFNDFERGIVWELTLGLLPKHVRLLLLSATVGNSVEFSQWLRRCHDRRLELVQSTDRRVPLAFEWVGDQLLNEQIESMADGDDSARRTPALIFCFNREQCWSVAEQLKGKRLLGEPQKKKLIDEVAKHDWSKGIGPKLKTIVLRGVGVHHAGLLPRYKRIVEFLFQRKLLAVTVCTETLSAGLNLPARSVVLTTLIKGPPQRKKLVDPSSAHQMFGRAGRPQFDDRGFVYALAHDDDVKILRWKEKYDTIPENTKDPGLIKAKKKLKKKMPKRRTTEQYWNESQFDKLIKAPPVNLASQGPLTWRLLAYLLSLSPEVDRIRTAVSKRLLDAKQLKVAEKELHRMLMTLHAAGFIELEPEPPKHDPNDDPGTNTTAPDQKSKPSGTLAILLAEANVKLIAPAGDDTTGKNASLEREQYVPEFARPTSKLADLLVFRSINPVYGVFLIEYLGMADSDERIQAFESVLNISGSVVRSLRVPPPDQMPPGPLATELLHPELLSRGLATQAELTGIQDDDDDFHERVWPMTLGDKLRRYFDSLFPNVGQLRTTSVWAAGELLRFGGDFNKLVTARKLAKQEGVVFRHLLRFILLLDEFAMLCPPDLADDEWQGELRELAEQVTRACHGVDPDSTDKMIADMKSADMIVEEPAA